MLYGQIARHILNKDIPALVLSSIVDTPWEIPPAVGKELFLLHFVHTALQIIWLHHASGTSPAELNIMPHTPPDPKLLQCLELCLPQVCLQACIHHQWEAAAQTSIHSSWHIYVLQLQLAVLGCFDPGIVFTADNCCRCQARAYTNMCLTRLFRSVSGAVS